MPDPAAPTPTPGQSSIIARELGGELPCSRCRYNLQGLSVRAVCPECGTPVRATLLTVVDPRANELQPLFFPRLSAMALMIWSFSALAAALCVWSLRLFGTGWIGLRGLSPGLAAVALTALCGVASAVFIYPHAIRGPRSGAIAAALGTLAFIPLTYLLWLIHVEIDTSQGPAYGDGSFSPRRVWLVLGVHAFLVVITLCLRPNARLLWVRSLLMRTGRVDRQTLIAIAGVVAIAMVGDVLRLLGALTPPATGALLDQIGQLLILVGSLLLLLGLLGLVVDSWRLYPVVVQPPLSIERLLRQDAKGPTP